MAPTCGPQAITPALAFYAEQAGGKAVQSPEGPFQIAAQPIVSGGDVESFTTRATEFGDECELVFKGEAAKKFRAATAALSKQQQRMAIMVGNDLLIAPRVNEEIPNG